MAVELAAEQFGWSRKREWMEPEPEISVPIPQPLFVGQASCTNNTMVFSLMDQTVLQTEPKIFFNAQAWKVLDVEVQWHCVEMRDPKIMLFGSFFS